MGVGGGVGVGVGKGIVVGVGGGVAVGPAPPQAATAKPVTPTAVISPDNLRIRFIMQHHRIHCQCIEKKFSGSLDSESISLDSKQRLGGLSYATMVPARRHNG